MLPSVKKTQVDTYKLRISKVVWKVYCRPLKIKKGNKKELQPFLIIIKSGLEA